MNDVELEQQITDRAQLRRAYREPGQAVVDKVVFYDRHIWVAGGRHD